MSATPDIFDNSGAGPAAIGLLDPPSRAPLAFHRRLPHYAVTPLVRAPALAQALGVREVLVKDESNRLGMPSYKILGASWATYREVLDAFSLPEPAWGDVDELAAALTAVGPLTLAAATDGNHGRAVARLARMLGWAAVIYVPTGTAPARIHSIADEGARVEVVNGTYDDAVARAAADASSDTLVISDTAWPGYDRVPRRVIAGYSTIFWEIDDQIRQQGYAAPTHVAVQMGVGSLAAAAVLHYRVPVVRARLLGVEPADAACVLESVRAGHPVDVPGPHRSIMAGLNCGRPSPLAFPLLSRGIDMFVAVTDDDARAAMRELAGASVVSGESGAAGLAGAAAVAHSDAGHRFGLNREAILLLVSTEGATDPAAYADIVRPAAPHGDGNVG